MHKIVHYIDRVSVEKEKKDKKSLKNGSRAVKGVSYFILNMKRDVSQSHHKMIYNDEVLTCLRRS
jgi:hypothetical protein